MENYITAERLCGASENCISQVSPLLRLHLNLSQACVNMAAPWSKACEAMERSIRARVPPMLTDLYQFTMAYAYWNAGRHNEPAVFELFFRENPFGGGFSLFSGVHDCLLFLRNFRFTEEGEWPQVRGRGFHVVGPVPMYSATSLHGFTIGIASCLD